MWSQLVLCCLVAIASATNAPAWKDNQEYVYQVRGRTLASLHEVSNDYSGVLLKAKLIIRPKSDGVLDAKIAEPQYAQVHAKLAEGWETIIPDSQLSYKSLPISQKPFQIVLQNGAIRDLIVNKEIPNWEANVIKSIVSELQLDTQAENLIPSHINVLAQEDSQTAVFKTMEETVTGVAETLYEIHHLPEYVLQTKPWLVPQPELRGNGLTLEVVKTKNYTHSEERPAYHFGFAAMDGRFEPSANQLGKFFTRATLQKVALTGTLNRYTLQSSVSIDEIMVAPSMNQQRGSVRSMLNLTLLTVQQPTEQFQPLSNPVALGSLVYRFDKPYASKNEARQGKQFEHRMPLYSAESEFGSEAINSLRTKRTINRGNMLSATSDSIYAEEQYWQQDQPRLSEAPESPFLPYTVGYEGQALKKKQNIVENARKLAQLIGQEMQQPEKIPQQNTLGKFMILTSTMRTMDHNEMQQVAQALYTKEREGVQAVAWTTVRDAIAQTGTGPALMCIQDWIKTNKISGEEAAEIVATAANAARQPTEEYMKSFYQMVKNEQVMEQRHLNESVLLAFTRLAHEVYVNREESHSKFPVHSFGSFRTEAGQSWLKTKVIPYLTQQLNEAVARTETERIHVYIRALGNVGHQLILEAFEPFLEGKKQCSQFQRVLMVVSLDKLVNAYPKVARSVLYKIYQNPSEYEQVRVAAVYQLMRTEPSADMLQRMAIYTNTDSSEYVNAAVKSIIEDASELKGYQYEQMRNAAVAAKHHLTKAQYGAQYSKNVFRSYVVDQINTVYKKTFQTFGAEDSILPKGIKYSLNGYFGGVKSHLVDMHAMVSSIDDLINVFQHQSETFRENKQERQSQRSENQQWSPENIAKLLNIQTEQREQLEGNLHFQLGDMQKIFAFDNHTFEMMPELLRELEASLKNGKQFNYQRMSISNEIAIAFPTLTGLPFIFTYDMPTLVRFEGKIRASAQPQISNGKGLNKPDVVESEFEIRAVISGRTQSQLAFITPFDNQRYSAGYDKNFQVYLPLAGKLNVDLKESQIKTEIRSVENTKDIELMHFSTWPYTSQDEIYTTEPKKQIIHKKQPYQVNTVFGQKSTGIAFNVRASLEEHMTVAWVYEKLQRYDWFSSLLNPWVDERIQHNEITVRVDLAKSTTDKIVSQFGFKNSYEQRRREENAQGADISEFDQISEEPLKRQTEFLKRASADINSVHACVYDAKVEFQGHQQIKYAATLAYAKSNVDPKGRVLILFKKNGGEGKQLRFYLSAKSHAPNTNGLDMNAAMKLDSAITTQIQAAFGENFESATKIQAQIKNFRNEKRQQHLIEHPEYQECQRQMQEGNHQLYACAKMTAIANLLNEFTVKVEYQNMKTEALNQGYQWYSLVRHALFPHVEEHMIPSQGTGKEQHLEILGEFDADLHHFHLNIKGQHGQVQIRDVKVNEWAKNLLVPHPVFHVRSRLMGPALGYPVYRPFCVVDQQAASTFDNKTYPVELSSDWSVLLHYVPRRSVVQHDQKAYQTVQQQLREQVENYAVLARQSGSQKEIKLVFQTPETQGKLVEINFKPASSQQYPKLYINGEEIKYNAKEGTDFYDGHLQVYALPNGEVKAELYKAFYVIYDGSRVKLTIVDTKFRDATRGLCGTFTGEEQTDFLSAKGCILRHPEEFVASYTILEHGKAQNQKVLMLKERSDKLECLQRRVMYANVISSVDAGRMRFPSEVRGDSRHACTKLQTQYVVDGEEVCFTLKPLPVCKSTCQRRGSVSKNIPVHCVQQTSATQLWMNEIQKGASPDFSLKHESRSIRMEIAQNCA